MFKVNDYIVIKGKKEIKIINEIEKIANRFIIYTTDNHSYDSSQCETIKEAFNRETNGQKYTEI